MLRVLFLTQILPYPPDAGPKVKTWNVIRYLGEQGHAVTLVSFVRPEELAFLPVVRQTCTAVYTVPIHRSRVRDAGYWLKSNLSGRPFLIERDDSAEMRALVRRLLAEDTFDVIHADQLTMTQFALHSDGYSPVNIFDAHNAVWTIVERMASNAAWFLRPVAALEARRVKRYEGMLLQAFDYTLAVTEPDRRLLLEAAASHGGQEAAKTLASRMQVIPIAVDTCELQPVRRRPGSLNLMTLGTLHYPPNADGIRWFIHEVFPQVRAQAPGATLMIVGKNPPQDFINLAAEQPGVFEVTGYVPDLQPYFEQAALVMIPVRSGGGMRVRILEAFARGMPVVTTTVGLEGIEARPGDEVIVADDPDALAAAVVNLLKDETEQRRLAENGRRLAEQRYDWQVVLAQMGSVYQEIEQRRRLK